MSDYFDIGIDELSALASAVQWMWYALKPKAFDCECPWLRMPLDERWRGLDEVEI